MILPAKTQKMGEVDIRRVLPRRERRRVGPFVFLDEMGPVPGGPTVPAHPHIGLSTVTYLFSGEILHRDSLGSEQVIVPGDVNLMVAGRGIVHSEQMLRGSDPLRGLQFWMALRREDEECEPSFRHFPAHAFPKLGAQGARGTLLMGRYGDLESPVQDRANPFFSDWSMDAGAKLVFSQAAEELCLYVCEGRVAVEGAERELLAGDLYLPESPDGFRLQAPEASRLAIFGGAALDGDRQMWWNFVSSSKERIDSAKRAWESGTFPRGAL